MPLFSIVIPTRNRAHLLQYALQSALNQTFDDYDVVVSDNYSSDETAETVHRLADKKVRYLCTNEALPMPESWEFALNHADGEYVFFLCDDDAICPRLLETIAGIIAERRSTLLSWKRAIYCHSTWFKPEYRNRVIIPSYTGKTFNINSGTTLTNLFSFRAGPELPVMANSFCHRDIITQVKARMTRFFVAPCPDRSAAAVMLSEVNNYTYIDDILMLGGVGKESIGAAQAYNRGKSSVRFTEEFHGEKILSHVPLKAPVVANFDAETLLRVKKLMPERFSSIDLDWSRYFILCYKQILFHQKTGVDVSKDSKEFFDVLSKQPLAFQTKVRFATMGYKQKLALKDIVRRIIYNFPMFIGLNYFLPYPLRKMMPAAVIRGEDAGFSNILECVRKLDLYIIRN